VASSCASAGCGSDITNTAAIAEPTRNAIAPTRLLIHTEKFRARAASGCGSRSRRAFADHAPLRIIARGRGDKKAASRHTAIPSHWRSRRRWAERQPMPTRMAENAHRMSIPLYRHSKGARSFRHRFEFRHQTIRARPRQEIQSGHNGSISRWAWRRRR
jgi:hypothetical protein